MAIKINNNTIINDNKGIEDVNNSVGVGNSVLTSTGTSIEWKSLGNIGSSSKAFTFFTAHVS